MLHSGTACETTRVMLIKRAMGKTEPPARVPIGRYARTDIQDGLINGGVVITPLPINWIKTKRGRGVKSGRSGARKQGKLGLSCKANKCSDAGTGDPGVLPTMPW